MYLTGDIGPYTCQELILPDGYRVRFDRISSGTGYLDAVYEHTEAPDDYYGAKTTWVPATGGCCLQKKDETQYWFNDNAHNSNSRGGAPISIVDRVGNTITLQRDSNSNLTKITSPNDRYILSTETP